MSIAIQHHLILSIAIALSLCAVGCKEVPDATVKETSEVIDSIPPLETFVRVPVDVKKDTAEVIRDTIAKVTSVPKVKATPVAAKPPKKATPQKIDKPVKPKPKRKRVGKFSFKNDVHDFGTIKSGDIIEHAFTFVNEGTKPITIKDADVTCGCTYPSFPFLPVAPGETGTIKVRYNSVGKEGDQEAKVTINSNADKSPYYLYLRGLVVKDTTKVDIKVDTTVSE